VASGIADLEKRVRVLVAAREWDQFHNSKDLAISLCLEAAVVLEHFQWKNDAKYPIEKSKGNHKKYTELSDVA